MNIENELNKIIKFRVPSEEELKQIDEENYNKAVENKENMSYWLTKLISSSTKSSSSLLVPGTKVLSLNSDAFKWLMSDDYKPDAVKNFNDLLVSRLGDFCVNKTLFMKTGNFSNKFDFQTAIIKDRNQIGQKFLDMFYAGLCLGVPLSAEVVLREFIEDREDIPTIYNGMPLHTEYRVFYDFDTKQVLGVSNYWHPDEMERYLRGEDQPVYASHKEKLVEDFNKFKKDVAKEVSIYMEGVEGLEGAWSIDVMKNGIGFWIIDLARMERSALGDKMEEIKF